MPQFVKMGLYSNMEGWVAKPGSEKRNHRRRRQRRRVLPGYPMMNPFLSVEEVRRYLSGDRVICLLCGKDYRELGQHIQRIHGVTVDRYKEMYRIPWTYALVSAKSKKTRSRIVQRRMREGYQPPMKSGEELKEMVGLSRRRCPFKEAIAIGNLGEHMKVRDPSKPVVVKAKRGTLEFHEKMRGRPQCQPEVAGKRFGDYWRGRKQSPEHVAKRMRRLKYAP